jgi:hypothetical protein
MGRLSPIRLTRRVVRPNSRAASTLPMALEMRMTSSPVSGVSSSLMSGAAGRFASHAAEQLRVDRSTAEMTRDYAANRRRRAWGSPSRLNSDGNFWSEFRPCHWLWLLQ